MVDNNYELPGSCSGDKEEDMMGESELAIFDLNVPEDRTEAWIEAKGELPETATVETVKGFLKEKGDFSWGG